MPRVSHCGKKTPNSKVDYIFIDNSERCDIDINLACYIMIWATSSGIYKGLYKSNVCLWHMIILSIDLVLF